MKVKKHTYEHILRDLKVVINYVGWNTCRQAFQQNPHVTAYDLWCKVYCNRAYSSDNPNVDFVHPGNGRLLPYQPDFEMYPDHTNDDTLKTALLKACQQIL